MTFLTPFLTWGMLLGSIPIIIHLLNRRRFRRVEWAPMKYLKLTIQRNRRKIQIEELILLIMRVAGLVLLFFFLARPVLNPTGLERWLGSGGRSSVVMVVDDSVSMGYAAGDASAFQHARETAAALMAAARPQDRCSIVSTSSPRAAVLHDIEGARRDELTAAAMGLPLTGTHTAWPSVLEGVDELLRSCTYPTIQVTILTDFRKAGWGAEVAPIAARWARQGVKMRMVDVGDDEMRNVVLESLLPVDRTVLAGAESRWEAVVRNNSSRTLAAARAVLRVDDKPTEVVLPDIPPRGMTRMPLTVHFPGPGPHDVSLQLPDDELTGDNRRWAAVTVKDSLLIRLVDGEPSTVPFGSEVDYLAAPLSIGVGAAEAWRVEVAQENDFLSPRRETPDVLVLANVAAPTADQASRLGPLVREGMGLLIFTGARVDTGMYNDMLLRQGGRILPCAMKGLLDQNIRGLIVEPLRPSPLEALLQLKATALERVAIRQIMAVDEPADQDQARVLARWNDPARSPAIIERVAGEGRVLLWTTTADRAGNDWPVEPSFVLALREAVRGSARPTSMAHTVTAGEPVRRVVRSNQAVSNVRLNPPGGGEPSSLSAVPIAEDPGELAPAVAIQVPDTRQTGIYRLAWDEGSLGNQQDVYAANADPRESALERISAEQVKALFDPLDVEIASARNGETGLLAPTGREIWRDLACGLFVLLIGESIFATWAGRSR